jgi:microcin C transport system substrate-binding protein
LAFTRRHLLHGGALIAAAPAIKVLTGASPIEVARAQTAPADLKWRHGLSLFGEVKYPEGFKHFDYVNADAPKGGTVRQIALGTFDNFNMVVSGVKGSIAGAVGLIYEPLTLPS